MKVKQIIVTGLILLCSLSVSGQGQIDSPYSIFGLGDMVQKGSGYNWGLGGTGIGVRNGTSLNNINPASYTSIQYPFTQLADFSFNVSMAQQEDKNNQSPSLYGEFSGAGFWFRLNKHMGLNLGLAPYSNVKYNIEEQQAFEGIEGNYLANYTGEGGLNQIYAGYAYEFFNHLSLGIHGSYIFGNLTHSQAISSTDVNYGVQIENKTRLNTFHLDYGLQYFFSAKKEDFVIGATFANQNSFAGTNDLLTVQGSDTLQEKSTTSDSYLLPTSYGAGFSWTHNKKWMLAGDYQFERWSEGSFEEGFDLQDATRISGGLSLLPNRSSQKYIDRMGLNLGGYYKNTYLKLDGQSINQYGITAGMTFPTKGTSLINVIYERGFRGADSNNVVNENLHTITFNFSFFDIWFSKNKFQ